MEFLLQTNLWLAVLGGIFVLRQLCIIFAAEKGRKQDLVKRLYKVSQDFNIAVLIPYLDSSQLSQLIELLGAIDEQEYPASKVRVNIVVSQETQEDLSADMLRPNVRLWTYPSFAVRYEEAVTWLIDRCLAAGGTGLFVFLKPEDMVKPDFFRNIVARGFDSFAIQGYVARKTLPETPLAKVIALGKRLHNRIGNAGRHHLGLSCRLMDSGWAIKQEVLEMIPFRRGRDLDNLEYTIRLNLENFRVNWAPNVVVYSDEETTVIPHVTNCIAAFFNRIRMAVRYGGVLLMRTLFRLDLSHLENLFLIVKPPTFITGVALIAIAAGIYGGGVTAPPGSDMLWLTLAATLIAAQILSAVVARCKPADYFTLCVLTPVVYVMGLGVSPVGLINYVSALITENRRFGKRGYKQTQATRFNEDLEATHNILHQPRSRRILNEFLEENAPAELLDEPPAPTKKWANAAEPARVVLPVIPTTKPPTRMRLPREQVKTVQLTNGKKQVECILKTTTTFSEDDREQYQLTLEYKNVAFSTATYRILDQAFYELHSKLAAKGFTLLTCGSCGNFYNPTADVPGALRNAGVCLFGKRGRDVNLDTDAVTVLTPWCEHHCPMALREQVVSEWKDSLARKKARI